MTAKLIVLADRIAARAERSDADLLADCAGGDEDALAALFDRHHATVWRFIGRLLNPATPEIDDLVQSTFIEVWKSAPRFGGRSEVRTWILGIAYNVSRRQIRSEKRRRIAMQRLAEIEREPHLPEPAWQDRLMLERLQAALQSLSPELRTAYVMCELEGAKGVDAARALGVRPGTMWRRLHDAKKRLRRALEGGKS